jgi:AcrR family transcriptional regulator
MDHIAAAVKIARTTLYEYYRSKEDILFSLIDQIVEEPHLRALEGSTREKMEILAEQSLSRLQRNFVVYKILFQEMPTLGGPAADRMRKWQRLSLESALGVIREGMSARVFSQSLSEEDIGFAYKALIGQRLAELLLSAALIDPAREAKRLVDLLWSGVGHREDNRPEHGQ